MYTLQETDHYEPAEAPGYVPPSARGIRKGLEPSNDKVLLESAQTQAKARRSAASREQAMGMLEVDVTKSGLSNL